MESQVSWIFHSAVSHQGVKTASIPEQQRKVTLFIVTMHQELTCLHLMLIKCCVTSIKVPGFFCCFFNGFIEIQFTHHTVHPFKLYNSMAFTFISTVSLGHFHNPKKKPCTPWPSPQHSIPPSQGNHLSTFCIFRFAYSGHFL